MLSLRARHQGVAIQSETLSGMLGRCDGIPKVFAGLPRRDVVPPRNDKVWDDWVAKVMEGFA
jgi:hypothetical protein